MDNATRRGSAYRSQLHQTYQLLGLYCHHKSSDGGLRVLGINCERVEVPVLVLVSEPNSREY